MTFPAIFSNACSLKNIWRIEVAPVPIIIIYEEEILMNSGIWNEIKSVISFRLQFEPQRLTTQYLYILIYIEDYIYYEQVLYIDQ